MRRLLDVAGAALLLAAVTWALTGGRSAGDRVGPLVLTYLAVGVAFAGGQLAARRFGPAAPAAVVVVGGTVALLAGFRSPIGSAGAGPFGYGNANGALYAQAALAALLAATTVDRARLRALALGAAGLFAVATLASGSVMAAACLAAAVGLVATARAAGVSALVAPAGASAVVLAVGLTAALALRPAPPPGPETVAVRVALWSDATRLLVANPLNGVGAGGFAERTTVSPDPDLRWAHSGFLQQGAEQGVVGLALLFALIGWALVRCWRADDGTLAPALGAAAITALALQASVDYVLHFGVLPVTAALIVGAATMSGGRGRRSGTTAPPRPADA